MTTKFKEAYKTAWRWPETNNDTHSVVWSGRALVYIAPIAAVLLTFALGLLIFSTLFSLLLSGFVGLAIVILTVTIFHPQYHEVQSLEAHEDRITRFFHGFPQYTDIPLMENGENEWIAYGHIDPFKFVSAICTVVESISEDDSLSQQFATLAPFVSHEYAQFRNAEEDFWDEGIQLCVSDLDQCFPITRLQL